MRFLIIFIFLISNTFANENPNIKNLILNKELKEYTNLTILDDQNNHLNLSDYKGNFTEPVNILSLALTISQLTTAISSPNSR